MPVLYHNPRCSKSRQAVLLFEESKIDVDIHLYLKDSLSYNTLKSLLERLDGDVRTSVRTKDKKFKLADTSNLNIDDITSIALFLSNNGELMERPWYDSGNETVIGRPISQLARYIQ